MQRVPFKVFELCDSCRSLRNATSAIDHLCSIVPVCWNGKVKSDRQNDAVGFFILPARLNSFFAFGAFSHSQRLASFSGKQYHFRCCYIISYLLKWFSPRFAMEIFLRNVINVLFVERGCVRSQNIVELWPIPCLNLWN